MPTPLQAAITDHEDAYDRAVVQVMAWVAVLSTPVWLSIDALTHAPSDLPWLWAGRAIFVASSLILALAVPTMEGARARTSAVAVYWIAGLAVGFTVPGSGDAYAIYVVCFSLMSWAAGGTMAFPLVPNVTMQVGLVFGFMVAHAVLGGDRPLPDVLGGIAFVATAAGLCIGSTYARHRTRRQAFEATWAFHERSQQLASSQLQVEVERQAREAQTAFLTRMSHELRTPLNAMLGYLEMARDDVVDAGLTQTDQDLQKVHDAGQHLLSMLGDLLDVSAIEDGDVPFAAETFAASELVRDTVARLRPAAEGKGLDMTFRGDDVQVHHDPARVRQALLALVVNAIKFTAEGSVDIQLLAQPEGVRVVVDDTGIGVSETDAERVFERFTQADSSLTRRHDGAGLGLALARSLARRMGGDVLLEDHEGPGARFVLQLPLEQPA